jgi:hypothetical protein
LQRYTTGEFIVEVKIKKAEKRGVDVRHEVVHAFFKPSETKMGETREISLKNLKDRLPVCPWHYEAFRWMKRSRNREYQSGKD